MDGSQILGTLPTVCIAWPQWVPSSPGSAGTGRGHLGGGQQHAGAHVCAAPEPGSRHLHDLGHQVHRGPLRPHCRHPVRERGGTGEASSFCAGRWSCIVCLATAAAPQHGLVTVRMGLGAQTLHLMAPEQLCRSARLAWRHRRSTLASLLTPSGRAGCPAVSPQTPLVLTATQVHGETRSQQASDCTACVYVCPRQPLARQRSPYPGGDRPQALPSCRTLRGRSWGPSTAGWP